MCRQMFLQRHPGPLHGAGDRRHAGVEQPRDFLGRPAEHVAQDQRRPLPGREVLDRGQERQLDRLPGDHRRIRLRLAGRGRLDHPVRKGLQPGDVGTRRQRDARIRRRRHVVREYPAGPSVEGVEAGVGRDPVQPGADRRATLEAMQVPPGAQERLLHQILRLVERAQHPVAVHPQLAPIALHERGERGVVARSRDGHRVVLVVRVVLTRDQLQPSVRAWTISRQSASRLRPARRATGDQVPVR
jgi:hypothetical protein